MIFLDLSSFLKTFELWETINIFSQTKRKLEEKLSAKKGEILEIKFTSDIYEDYFGFYV